MLYRSEQVGRVGVVRLLCGRGAAVEAEKSNGGTALHTAADSNQTETVAVLVTSLLWSALGSSF